MRIIVLVGVAMVGVMIVFTLRSIPVSTAAVPTMPPTRTPRAIPPTITPTQYIPTIPTGTPGPEWARVVPIGLFLRVGPGVDNASVRILGQGERVKILQRVDGWAEVLAGDVITGWVNANYLQLINGDD